jgi:hypothetical protein
MLRVLIATLTTLGLLAATQQEASAWHKTKFNAGINISAEGAGNTALWGLWKSGPMPCSMQDGACPRGYGGAMPMQDGAFPRGYGGVMPMQDGLMAPPQDQPERLPPPTAQTTRPASYQSYAQEDHQSNAQEDTPYYYPSYYYGR